MLSEKKEPELKLHQQDWPIGKPVGHFLDVMTDVGRARPGLAACDFFFGVVTLLESSTPEPLHQTCLALCGVLSQALMASGVLFLAA